ncbi:MAG: hypothetical protein FRX49_08367 [Trebouxia sp. A1-2]|nr:MAG: hypothetical protein FRX49_08367 [Trebouxia sp. A1-2]
MTRLLARLRWKVITRGTGLPDSGAGKSASAHTDVSSFQSEVRSCEQPSLRSGLMTWKPMVGLLWALGSSQAQLDDFQVEQHELGGWPLEGRFQSEDTEEGEHHL